MNVITSMPGKWAYNFGKKAGLFFTLLWFASLSTAQVNCGQVPSSLSGFVYMGEHNGSKYFCSNTNNHTWASAKSAATSAGGHLAIVNSQAENDFLKNGIIASVAWIGFTDEASEGAFKWVNGSTATYTNWASGEPNNTSPGGGEGDYVVLNKSDGKWYDRNGADHNEYVVEIPCPASPPPSGNCMDQLAYWSLNACSAGSSYSEFTAATSVPSGFSTVTATTLTSSGDHSCTPSPFDKGICHAIRDYCGFSDNHSNAYKFTVTIKPQTGKTAKLSKLSFYEAAPDNYTWTNGQSGDNDPPSKYGLRVRKGSTEIFKQIDIPTTAGWTLEEFDFSNDPDFTVSAQTTFSFELLGYCRQGTIGYAVWDIDEIKVFGCGEGPCDNQGGDSDGDGVCNNQDCAPNDSNFPKQAGTPCNDGNPNTVNDVIQADGCTCAGTFNPCANQGGDSDGDGVCNNQDCAPNDPNFPKPAGTACNDGNPNTVNDVIQADGCTCAGTFNPCASQGGDSDGDGVCNNQDCAPNDPNFPKPAGTPCNDGNPNTSNDVIQADGCTCAGTPVQVCDNITWGGTIGFGGNCAGSVTVCNASPGLINNCTSPTGGSGNLETIWLRAINNPNCVPPSTTIENIANDPYWSVISGATSLTYDPGVISQQTCFLRCTRRAGCTTYIESNIISVGITPGCGGGGGTPDCNTGITITTGPGTITVSGLGGAPISSLQIFTSTWQPVENCFANCGATKTVNVPAGSYFVYVKYYTAGYQLICEKQATVTVGGGNDPCASQGGDSDGDGVCNNQDCQPNNPAFPATPGTPCNDGNPNTSNDVVTANGCGCQGTTTNPCANQGGDSDGDGVCNNQDCQPNNPAFPATPGTPCNDGNPDTSNDVVTANGCGCAGTPSGGGGTPDCVSGITITTGPGTITVSGLGGAPISSLQIFTSTWQPVENCFANCGATKTVNVPAGSYIVYAKYYTAGYQLICEKQATVTVGGGNDPCASQGGDSDGDGVCNNQDCQPNNPAFPATPGTPCNDGNPNTSNDVVTANGCGCAGTPIDPCASQGGDSDGDGVCNNQDCQPNNPAFPATPGTPCNDGNANTTNDVVTANGCGCAGTPVTTACTSTTLVTYTMQACNSCTNDGSASNWSELTPTYSGNGGCNGLTATPISPKVAGTEHSCTPRSGGGNALCTGSGNTLRFSVTLPNGGDLSGISFFEQAPNQYVWSSTSNVNCSDSNTGTNNKPTKFDLKVFKGNTQVFSQTYNTQSTWNLRNVSFAGNNAFNTTGSTTYTFEFTPHSSTGSGSVKAWDIDEIVVLGCCGNSTPCASQGGDSDGDGVCNTQDCQPNNPAFPAAPGSACNDGNPNTSNDVVTSDGCGCAGTPSGGGSNDCSNISITPGLGKITVTGLDGSPITSLHVFNSAWGTVASCFANCGASQTVNVPTGTYHVYAKYYSSGYQLICEKSATVSVANALLSNANFDLQIAKEEEHAEIIWMHDQGDKVASYTVERSLNGSDFTELENHPSKGNPSVEVYHAFDFAPATGDNYYRIRMSMLDGSTTYSEVRRINYADLVDFTIFPNPANDFAKINLETVVGKKEVTISVFNNLGTAVKTFDLGEVYSKYYQMDLRELKEGHYIVWLNIPGHKPLARKLVVGKM